MNAQQFPLDIYLVEISALSKWPTCARSEAMCVLTLSVYPKAHICFRKGKGNQITLFFDMTDAGLNNLDMEYIKFLINLFKSYYPDFLNYILIFEMPWILNGKSVNCSFLIHSDLFVLFPNCLSKNYF